MKYEGRFPHSALEFFAHSIYSTDPPPGDETCPFRRENGMTERCNKTRKSDPSIAIGTCTAEQNGNPVILSPWRLLEGGIVFDDVVRASLEGTSKFAIIPEFQVPGGGVDYLLVALDGQDPTKNAAVGLELQAMDTTGSLYQSKLDFFGTGAVAQRYKYGMNWKHIAKLTLIQALQKLPVFASHGYRYVWAVQDVLLDYLEREFDLSDFREHAATDPFALFSYALEFDGEDFHLRSSRAVSAAYPALLRAAERPVDANFDLHQQIANALNGGRPYSVRTLT